MHNLLNIFGIPDVFRHPFGVIAVCKSTVAFMLAVFSISRIFARSSTQWTRICIFTN